MQNRLSIYFKILLYILIFHFIIPLPWGMTEEAKVIGKVVALRGVVSAVSTDNQKRVLKLKDSIFLHDTIHTAQSRIQLMFRDNTLISLGRNSQILIQDYLWDPGNKESNMKTYVKEGSFRVMGGAITREAPQNFKTQTPAATIGIRGSMYAGLYTEGFLSVVFEGGLGIYVANDLGRVEIDIPGFGTQIRGKEQVPEKPKKFDQKDLEKIEGSLASNEKTEISKPDHSEEPALKANLDVTEVVTDYTATTIESEVTNANPKEGIILSMLNKMGYSGIKSTAVPTSGITYYKGRVHDGDEPTEKDKIRVAVNWSNGRLFATDYSDDPEGNIHHGFGFGNVNANGTIDNVVVMGTGNDDFLLDPGPGNDDPFPGPEPGEEIITMTMHDTFGQFYGSGPDALGIALEGYDIVVKDQTKTTAIKGYLAATKETTQTSTIGSELWNGFFVGVAEDMDGPDQNRRIYINSNYDSTNAAQDLDIDVDKSKGRLSGTLNGTDIIDPANNQLVSLNIGSPTDNTSSVYVSDAYNAAVLSGNNVVKEGNNSGDLKAHGNYLVSSSGPALESGENTVWGYWELAYKGPASNRDYHLHFPGSLWIAGVQDTTTVKPGFKGTYTGQAKGVRFDEFHPMGKLDDGTVNLDIDFNASVNKISGNIDFTNAWNTKFIVGNTASISNTGFTARISGIENGPDVNSSGHINGAFYGTNAESIAGNFSAKEDVGTTHYLGIFAGKK